MANVPAEVQYGRVTGYFTAFIADTGDTGNEPDEVQLNGTIELIPSAKVLRWSTTTPPRVSAVTPAILNVVDGVVLSPTGGEVWVVASDQPDGEPDHIQWTAIFHLNGVVEQPATVTFDVPAGSTVDLATVVGVTEVPPTVHLISEGDVGQAVEDYLAANPPSGDGLPPRTGADSGKTIVLSGTTPVWAELGVQPAITDLAADITAVEDALDERVPAATSTDDGYYLKYVHGTGTYVWAAVPTGGLTSVVVADIADAGAAGASILLADTAANVRTLLGVPVVGTGATDAKAGNYQPASTNITDASAIGRQILTAANAAAVNALLGSGAVTLENIPDLYRHYNTSTNSYPERGTTRTDLTITWVGPVPPTGNLGNDIWEQTP